MFSFFRAYETSLLVDQEISSEIPYNGKYICNLFVFLTTNNREKKRTKRNSSSQWKRRQTCEVYQNVWKFFAGNFRFISLSSLNFCGNFQLNGSLFGNSTILLDFLATFSRISLSFFLILNISDFLVEWKVPQPSKVSVTIVTKSSNHNKPRSTMNQSELNIRM